MKEKEGKEKRKQKESVRVRSTGETVWMAAGRIT